MSIGDIDKITKALSLLDMGGETSKESQGVNGKRGRPKINYRISYNDESVVLNKNQMEALERCKLSLINSAVLTKSMTESEFAEMCRLAVPQLMDRAIRIAMISEDAKEIMAVAKEITDRGYGKVSKVHDTESQETDYLRRSWDAFPKQSYNMGIIDVPTEGETEEE